MTKQPRDGSGSASQNRAGPCVLIVMDGFGIGDGGPGDATAVAHTPFSHVSGNSSLGVTTISTCGAAAAGTSYDRAALARLAGRASGSAARSLLGGFVELSNAGDAIEVRDAFVALKTTADALRLTLNHIQAQSPLIWI